MANKLLLKRPVGDWDPINTKTGEQLHFGVHNPIPVDLSKLSKPLRDQILDEISKGWIVDENGQNPFTTPPEETKPKFINPDCALADPENWPCQFSVDDSCPMDCIHVQVPVGTPEETEGEEEVQQLDVNELVEDLLTTPVKKLGDALSLVHHVPALQDLLQKETRKTAKPFIELRIEELQTAEAKGE